MIKILLIAVTLSFNKKVIIIKTQQDVKVSQKEKKEKEKHIY